MRAEDPATPGSELQGLTRNRSRSVRVAVAQNPNTPLQSLGVLGRLFPDAVARNPILDWLLLEDANWLERFDAISRERLLMEPSTGTGLLWWAARFGSADDKLAVAQNPACPGELLSYLAAINHTQLTAAVEAHISFTDVNTDTDTDNTDDGPPPDHGSAPTVPATLLTLADGSVSPVDIASLIDFDVVPASLFRNLIDGDVHVRRAIARSAVTTPDTLRMLCVDDDVDTRVLALSHPSSPTDVVDAVRGLESADPQTDLDVLSGLPMTTFLESLLVRHPNCDRPMLLETVDSSNWRLREAAAANRGLPVDIAVLLAADTDKDVRVALVGNPAVPAFILDWLSNDRVDEVAKSARAAVAGRADGPRPRTAGNRSAATDGLDLLISLLPKARHVGVILGRVPQIREEMLRDLAADPDWQIRRSCATNPSIPVDLLERLIRDSDNDVRAAVLANPRTSNEMVRKVADPGHEEVRCRLIRDESDPTVLHGYATDAALAVRESLADHPTLLPETISILASDGDAGVRERIANRVDLPPELVVKLAADSEPTVQQRIAERDDLPDEAVVGLFHDTRRTPTRMRAQNLRKLLNGTNQLTRAEVSLLKQAPSWLRLHIVARSASEPLLRLMAVSDDWHTRAAVAAHPLASVRILRTLATDNDYDVRSAVASVRQSLPDTLLRTLATDTHPSVREAVIKRHDLDTGVLDAMVFDESDEIRAVVSSHPLLSAGSRSLYRDLADGRPLPTDLLKELSVASARSRILVAQHPDTPPRVLATLAKDADWHVREAVARHPRATGATLRRLSTEIDRDVRRAASENPNIPEELLRTLIGDADESVRLTAGRHPRLTQPARNHLAAESTRRLTRSTAAIDRLVVVSSPFCPPVELRRRRNWQSPHWQIRSAVASHAHTPDPIVDRLAGDANRFVRFVARTRLTGEPTP